MTLKIVAPSPEYEIIAPKEAIVAWKHDEVTQQIISIVQQEIDQANNRLGRGETLGENAVQDTARGVGYVEGLRFLETMMEVIDFLEDKEDDSKVERKRQGKENT